MSEDGTMRGIAADYRRQAEATADPAQRIRLKVLANCCEKMAVALARLAKPLARPGIDRTLSRP